LAVLAGVSAALLARYMSDRRPGVPGSRRSVVVHGVTAENPDPGGGSGSTNYEKYLERYRFYAAELDLGDEALVLEKVKELAAGNTPLPNIALRDATAASLLEILGGRGLVRVLQKRWEPYAGLFGVEFILESCAFAARRSGAGVLAGLYHEMPRVRGAFVLSHLVAAVGETEPEFSVVARVMLEHGDAEPGRLFAATRDLVRAAGGGGRSEALKGIPSWQRASLSKAVAELLTGGELDDAALALAEAFPHEYDRWLMIRAVVENSAVADPLPVLNRLRSIRGWEFQTGLLAGLMGQLSADGAGDRGVGFLGEHLPNIYGQQAVTLYQALRNGTLASGDFELARELSEQLAGFGDRGELDLPDDQRVPIDLLADAAGRTSGRYAKFLDGAGYLSNEEIDRVLDDESQPAGVKASFWARRQDIASITGAGDIDRLFAAVPDEYSERAAMALAERVGSNIEVEKIAGILAGSPGGEVSPGGRLFAGQLGYSLGREEGMGALDMLAGEGGGLKAAALSASFTSLLRRDMPAVEEWLLNNSPTEAWQQPQVVAVAWKIMRSPDPSRALDWLPLVGDVDVRDRMLTELQAVLESPQ